MKQLTSTSYFSGRYSAIVLSGFFFLNLLMIGPQSAHALSCSPWVAELISLEGEASRRKSDDAHWQAVEIDIKLCPGDAIQIAANSRAILRLSDHSLMRLDARTTVTFMPPKEEGGFWMSLLKGIGHFISRVPRELNVRTPVADAKIEGTEFLIRASADEMFVTVFEGTVLAKNDVGKLRLTQGQSAGVERGRVPVMQAVVRPRDAVQWALHYPSVLQFEMKNFEGLGVSAFSQIAKSIASLKQGDRKKALEHLHEISGQIDDTRFLTYRASLRLSLGRVSEALDDLEQALVLKPEDGDILALKALVAVVKNDQDSAFTYADKAIKAAPNTVGPLMARSYVLQAGFKLEAAREAVETAVLQSPDNALAWSRLAELRLMFRDLDGALAAAERAIELDPGLSKTQSVLGFAHLIRIEISAAKAAFEKAIVMDQGAPMPRLGLGLALIREGDLEAGRREIETAAMLNPSHALIRSYLGKAYYEEKRDALAVEQYQMARELDPLDPTPDLYSAILYQTGNQPVEALQDIEKSIALNDNRAVYRSRLLLDDDLAARSVGQGRIYNDLGFEHLALLEASKSLSIDPGNHSAHRLLADSYASRSRHEIARVSELLQAQLLQPINLNPVRPQMAETNLNLMTGLGPADAAFNEFTPLFQRNQMRATVSGIVGSNETLGEEVVVSGIQDRFSYSMGQFLYESDGFREKNDVEHNIYNVFAQAALTSKFNIQAEYRRRETDQGDLRLDFNPNFAPSERRSLEQDTVRLGARLETSERSDLILSFIHNNSVSKKNEVVQVFGLDITIDNLVDQEGTDFQGQYLFRRDRFNLVLGMGANEIDQKGSEIVSSPFFNSPPTLTDATLRHKNAYFYLNGVFPNQLIWTFGLSFDSVDDSARQLDEDEWHPKFALQWRINDGLRFRVAAFRTMKRLLINNQTLEPTQVGGFNQFFDDLNGAKAQFYGIGLDAAPNDRLRGGLEIYRRDLDVPELTNSIVSFKNQKEDFYRLYVYWAVHSDWTISAKGQYEKIRVDFDDRRKLDEISLPVTIRYFSPLGIFAQLTTTYVRQKIGFDPEPPFEKRNEDFMVFDAAFGYRLPRRWGILSLEVRNLMDETFLYQDRLYISSDKLNANTRFIPDQLVLFRFTLNL